VGREILVEVHLLLEGLGDNSSIHDSEFYVEVAKRVGKLADVPT
jgi:hypothetical protein